MSRTATGGRSAGSSGIADKAAAMAQLVALFNVAAFTASRNTVVGSKASAFTCWIDSGHTLSQSTDALRCAVPTQSALVYGVTATFSLTNYYTSSAAASVWRGRHDGVAWHEYAVFIPRQATTAGALNTIHDTTDAVSGRSGAILSFAGPNTNTNFTSIQNASASVAANSTGAVVKDSPVWTGFSCTGGVWTRYVKTSALALTTTATPLAGNPANTLRLGLRHSGTQGGEYDWWGSFFRDSVMSANELERFHGLMAYLPGIA